MARYDVVVIGAGLGGLTAGAILARDGRKVLVIERSNSVGGAASSYKVGDLFVEGSLHETSDPRNPRDPKHAVLTRAGILDAVTWSPSDTFYEVRGGPIGSPLRLPASFDGARAALIARFPDARTGIEQLMREIEQGPSESERSIAVMQKLDSIFGSNEAVKCAIAANLACYHDDPATLLWSHFALAQGHYLRTGPCFVKGGSQRLSSALARAIKSAGSDAVLRRTVSNISRDIEGAYTITHTAKDGGDPRTVAATRVISNAAPEALASLLPDDDAVRLRHHYATMTPSISLFALTLGLSRPPREVGFTSYSTQLLPPWMTRLADYPGGTALMADEPGERMPPMAMADYSAIDSGVPATPYVLSIFGPDRLSNWDSSDMDRYRDKRARWQDAIVRYLDGYYPGLAGAVTASSFNTALSTRQYLNAPEGAVYGFAPTRAQADAARSPRTPIEGIYLSSAYANVGGYTGVVEAGAACADMILSES
ncbi:MAG: NAD(P)/FAD-dependent oxidoreductase [Proteobacteria bacterium]|nr:NAD(P)/FAD-dependent oxidoreductase [Pseudomonadota bacterium]